MKLDFKVGIVSLVGIIGTFPRGHGNYFSINYQGSEAMVINMSHEDYCDVKSKGLTPDGIECKVFGYNGTYAIYVVDERIPEKARSCFHRYGISGPHVANILRSVYDIDGFDCVMKTNPELAYKLSSGTSYDYDSKPGYVIKTIRCGCCNLPHQMEPEVYKRPEIAQYKVEINRDSGVFYTPELIHENNSD